MEDVSLRKTESGEDIEEDKYKQELTICSDIKNEDFDCEENSIFLEEDEKLNNVKSELETFNYLDEPESYNGLELPGNCEFNNFKLENEDIKSEPDDFNDSDDIFEEEEKHTYYLNDQFSNYENYICDNCGYQTHSKRNLKRHVIRHQNNLKVRNYTCDKCDFETAHLASLKRHFLRHKNPENLPKFQCPQCNYQCSYKHNLFTHMQRHNKGVPSMNGKCFCKKKCPICDYQSSDPSNLRRHILNHNKSNIKTFTCFHCGHQTNRKDNLETHIFRRHKPKECNSMGVSISEMQICNDAKKLLHRKPKKGKNHNCSKCNFEASSISEIQIHQQTHENKDIKSEPDEINDSDDIFEEEEKHTYHFCKKKCPTCDYQSNDPSNLRRHILNHNKSNTNTKTFTCFHCGHQANRKDNLETHIFRRHKPKERNFKRVSISEMQIYNNARKVLHRKPKKGKNHNCSKCNYKASSRSEIQIHQQSHENAKHLKIYRCSGCTYQTIYKISMDRHSLFHKDADEINMFQCFLCDYKAIRKDELRNHILRHSKKSKNKKTQNI